MGDWIHEYMHLIVWFNFVGTIALIIICGKSADQVRELKSQINDLYELRREEIVNHRTRDW
tara:strand:+ start:185 stop:367 length:183 start_codon:yes stop_codon:yes gene_type:complete